MEIFKSRSLMFRSAVSNVYFHILYSDDGFHSRGKGNIHERFVGEGGGGMGNAHEILMLLFNLRVKDYLVEALLWKFIFYLFFSLFLFTLPL